MEGVAATPYDAIVYPGFARVEAHPGVMGAVARLNGLEAAPAEDCRMLEIGCGDAVHLLALAAAFPSSRFTGIDLSPTAIAKGQEIAAAAGLKNIDLRVEDLLDFAGGGPFDYIVAHGFYSWVPAPVRDRLIAVCGSSLAEHGVAYISYNTLPGCYTRLMLRDMLLFHTKDIDDPRERIRQGRALIRFLSDAQPEGSAYQVSLNEITGNSDAALYHDDMAPVNEPCYLYQFASHASRHGLEYLGDAMWIEFRDRLNPPHIVKALEDLEKKHIVLKGQYLDFLKIRRFRRTLLCRSECRLDRAIKPAVVDEFWITGQHEITNEPENTPADSRVIRSREGETMTVSHPVIVAMIDQLAGPEKRTAPVREFTAEAEEADREMIARMLLYLCATDFVRLHTHQPRYAPSAAERPRAAALARLMAQRGDTITNMHHVSVDLKNTLPRHVLALLDGLRDREAIKRELTEQFRNSGAVLVEDDGRTGGTEEAVARLDRELEPALERLARLALLEA